MRIHLSSVCCGLVSGFTACQVDEDTGNDDSGVDNHSQQQRACTSGPRSSKRENSVVVRVDWKPMQYREATWSLEKPKHSAPLFGLLQKAIPPIPNSCSDYVDTDTTIGSYPSSTAKVVMTCPPSHWQPASELPEFTQEGDASLIDEWIIVPLMGSIYAVTIVDGQGQYRWYYIPEDQQSKPSVRNFSGWTIHSLQLNSGR